MTPAYRPHDAFIAPAREKRELWRLIPGVAVIVATYLGGLFLLHAYLSDTYGRWTAAVILQRLAFGNTPGMILLTLWTFLGLALGAMAAVRIVHRRSAATLFGGPVSRALNDFLLVTGAVAALNLLLLPLHLGAEEISPGLPFGTFLLYLPFALVAVLVQTGAEELVFRGYLQQQLAVRFAYPAVWMTVPSALFASGHYLPADFGSNAWSIAIWAFVFGSLAADLTARTGTLGAAMGFHFANNLSALLLVGLAGNLDGLALWRLTLDLSAPGVLGPALAVDFAVMIVSWLLARLVLRV